MALDMNTNNVYYLDMTGITGATTITLVNENNLPTEEILTDWGDGTQNSELTHTYSTAGEYIIVTNLQKDHGMNSKLTPYLTKAVIYYYEHPQMLFYNCQKMTEVTLTDNWVRTVNEKGSTTWVEYNQFINNYGYVGIADITYKDLFNTSRLSVKKMDEIENLVKKLEEAIR